MMNILISVNKTFLNQAETMLHSLRRNNREDMTVFLLNHSLSSAETKKFQKYLNERLKMNLVILDVSSTVLDQLPKKEERFSAEVFYRVLAQFVLPETVDRILWLDADIILMKNISDFYYQDFEGNVIAACPDAEFDGKEIARIKGKIGLSREHRRKSG